MKNILKHAHRRFLLKPQWLIAGAFLAAILIGAALLCLPPATAAGRRTDPLTALFTATSACCVTGLAVVDTGTHFTLFGQAVILALIQIGGIGIMTLGTFLLVLVVLAIALGVRAVKDWAPLAIGLTLGVVGLILVPLTGGAVNPARWFGPALVSGEWGGVWPYLGGQIVGAVLAFVVYKFIVAPGGDDSLPKVGKKPSTIPSPEA